MTSPEWKTGLPLAAVVACIKNKNSNNKMSLAHFKPENGRKNIELVLEVAQMLGVSKKIEIDEVGVNENKMKEYLQALYQLYHRQAQAATPPPAWNVIETNLRAIARAHPENVSKVPNRPSLQEQKTMSKLAELSMWMEVLLAFNGLNKPPKMVNRTNMQDWTGYELCAIISLCRPDLLDLKTADPNSKTNISLGLKALEKATGKSSLLEERDYGGEPLAMNTLFFDVTNLDADRNILRAIFDIARR